MYTDFYSLLVPGAGWQGRRGNGDSTQTASRSEVPFICLITSPWTAMKVNYPIHLSFSPPSAVPNVPSRLLLSGSTGDPGRTPLRLQICSWHSTTHTGRSLVILLEISGVRELIWPKQEHMRQVKATYAFYVCQQSITKVYLPRKSIEQYPSNSEYAPPKRTVGCYRTSMEEHRKLSVWLRRNVKACKVLSGDLTPWTPGKLKDESRDINTHGDDLWGCFRSSEEVTI